VDRVYYVYETAFGKIMIESDGGSIRCIKTEGTQEPEGRHKPDGLTDKAAKQLEEYFAGKRKQFDVPLSPAGTAFQLAVWEALREIPYGKTASYEQIAQAVNNPKACRAVGLANNRNPVWIMIPCHRVIGKNGSLTGYGGGLEMKKKLLVLESGKL